MANPDIPAQLPITVKISSDKDPDCITILPCDQKKVVHSITVFLNEDSEIPEIQSSLHPHRNVAMDSNPAVVHHGKTRCSSIDIYKESVKQLIQSKKHLPDDFIKTLLLQITRGLAHVHQRGGTFGQMRPDHIYISCHTNNAVLTDVWMNSGANHGHDKVDDIACLGNLFYFVFTGKDSSSNGIPDESFRCTEQHLAKDLLRKMTENTTDTEKKGVTTEHVLKHPFTGNDSSSNGIPDESFRCIEQHLAEDLLITTDTEKKDFTTEHVLKHPFFWSDREKIASICDAFDSVKHLVSNNELEALAKTEVFQGDWFKDLKLRNEEATEIKDRSKVKSELGRAKQINRDTILNLAQGIKKNRKVSYTTYLFNDCDELQKLNNILAKEWANLLKNLRSKDSLSIDDSQAKERIEEAVKKLGRNYEHVEYEVFDRVILVKDCEDSFRKESFYDLLRFFRNRKAHYCESNQNIQRCFQTYPTGFWKFFSSRFPNLLAFVYTNRDTFKLIKDTQPSGANEDACGKKE